MWTKGNPSEPKWTQVNPTNPKNINANVNNKRNKDGVFINNNSMPIPKGHHSKPKLHTMEVEVRTQTLGTRSTTTSNMTRHPVVYTSRKSLQHLLATGVPSCEEPWSAHEQTCKISREELPHPIKQRQNELRKNHFFVSLPLQCRLLILVDSCAEWGWPDTLGTIQGEELRRHQV